MRAPDSAKTDHGPRIPPIPSCFGREEDETRESRICCVDRPPSPSPVRPAWARPRSSWRPSTIRGSRPATESADSSCAATARSRDALLLDLGRALGLEPWHDLEDHLHEELQKAPAVLALAGLDVMEGGPREDRSPPRPIRHHPGPCPGQDDLHVTGGEVPAVLGGRRPLGPASRLSSRSRARIDILQMLAILPGPVAALRGGPAGPDGERGMGSDAICSGGHGSDSDRRYRGPSQRGQIHALPQPPRRDARRWSTTVPPTRRIRGSLATSAAIDTAADEAVLALSR